MDKQENSYLAEKIERLIDTVFTINSVSMVTTWKLSKIMNHCS